MTDSVTAKAAAAQHLRQRDLILAASGDGIYGVDTHGNTMFVNPAAARTCGYTTEEMMGNNLHDLIHHTKSDGSAYHVQDCPIFAAAHDGKIHRESDEVFWHKDGTSFPVEYVSTPIWDEGNLTGAVISFRDITERKFAEEALRESEERYRSIFDDTHAAVFLVDAQSRRILDSNKQACRMLGHSDAQLHEATDKDMFVGAPGDVKSFWEAVEKTGSADSESLSCRTADGKLVPVRLSASTLQIDGSEGLIVLANDISRRKEAEQRATELQDELHHVSRLGAMGEMASAMAHELNQPLTAVMNFMQASKRLLQSNAQGSQDKAIEFTDKAMAQVTRAGEIIRGLRSFVEKSEADMSFEDINEIIEEALLLTIPSSVSVRIAFQSDLADDLPELFVHRIKIQQVIVNLVRNAIEAMAEKEDARLRVSTRLSENEFVEISVRDSGTGLSQEQLTNVFQSFMTTKQQGMGVGLSICRSIIDDHDGRLWAENNAQGGATFYFTLPVNPKGSGEID